jgi:hypothetical protein
MPFWRPFIACHFLVSKRITAATAFFWKTFRQSERFPDNCYNFHSVKLGMLNGAIFGKGVAYLLFGIIFINEFYI